MQYRYHCETVKLPSIYIPLAILYLHVFAILTMPLIMSFSIYSGHHSILIAPSEVETNPAVWLTAVSNYKGKNSTGHCI